MKKLFALAVVLLFLPSSLVWAQTSSTDKPKLAKIIQITREDIKIGRALDHSNLVRAIRQTANSSGDSPHWVAATSITGNTSEQFFFGMYDSYADYSRQGEAMQRVFRAAFSSIPEANRDNIETHLSKKGIVAELREDLSFRADRATVADHAAWIMNTVRVKPGAASDFADVQKAIIDLHKKNNIDETWVVYQGAFGTNTPTFFVFYPLKTVADLDNEALDKEHERVFTRDVRRGFSSVLRDIVLTDESTLISVQPEISRPDASIVAANPSFWTVRDADTAAYASTRPTKSRKSVVEPASQRKEDKR